MTRLATILGRIERVLALGERALAERVGVRPSEAPPGWTRKASCTWERPSRRTLSDRFGLVLGFFGFDQPTYLSIVEHYAKKAGLAIAPERLREEALRWALDRSSRSGRTAHQFVDDVAGREALER